MGDAPEQAPEPQTDEAKAAEKAAKEAKAKLRLFKVTATRKLRVPPPVLELHEGANHFELEAPEAVSALAKRLAELVATGDVTVETLDGDGKPTPWPPASATDKQAKT
jgi:hypothetical protein